MQNQVRKQITLYSDGSSLGNPGPGGYGGILEFKGARKEYFGGDSHTTNNRMELRGVIEGLKLLKEPCDVEIISDSSYVVKAINEWLEGWVRKNFSKVKNVDLWKEYIEVSSPHNVRGTWVRGHNGHPENERCDELARNEAERIKLTL
ncbi:ribonuclease HI [Sulfurovum sp. TSL6]|uniref:ribonuclease HI n=1 Tax=Sulfurovum sp. TSL6 TaxID=2826995 RepID=UPI001CC6F99D|nr:ribonuclease HI [Sulfurovum sp. TSL6]GIU01074.1 ribonuclease HI [Sulfurovum sp. TSL6]